MTSCRESYQYRNGFACNCQEAQLTKGLTYYLERISDNGDESESISENGAAPDFQTVLAHLAGPQPKCLSNIVLIFIHFSGKHYFIDLQAETSA